MGPKRRLNTKKDKPNEDTDKPEKDKIYKCPHCDKILNNSKSYCLHIQIHADGYPYSCDKCQYKCKIKKYLARHMKKVHTKAQGPHCTICGKVFHFDCNLRNHMRVHSGEKPFKCKVCGKAFRSTYCLSMHKLIHTNEKPFQCSFCEYACRDNSTLKRHEDRHQGIYKTYPCKKCKKIFKKSTTLKSHIDEVHYGLDTRIYHCELCEKAFKTKASLRLHIRAVHEKACRVECEICGRIVSKNNILTHLKSHVDIRPYKCSFTNCGKSFKDQGTLKKHTLIHYPEHQHRCGLCDSRFPRITRLREHMMRHEKKGYTCDYCGVSFDSKAVLRIHIKKRHGVNCDKYICDVCSLVNYSRRSIIMHLRYGHGTVHDKMCKVCSKVFANSRVLKEHYLQSHNVRFVIQKNENENTMDDNIMIKDEPMEICAEFQFNYDVQKIEIDEHIPDPEYVDTETTMIYSEQVLAEDICRSLSERNRGLESEFDQFYKEQVMDDPTIVEHKPEYVDTETTLAYSKKVLAEDISRSIKERDESQPGSSFDEFFIQQMYEEPRNKNVPKKQIIDKNKLNHMKKTIDEMVNESKLRKEAIALEKMRRKYNKRIKMATKSVTKNVPKQIKYFKNSKNIEKSEESDDSKSDNDDKDLSQPITNDDTPQNNDETENDNDSTISRRLRVRAIIKRIGDDGEEEELEDDDDNKNNLDDIIINKNGKLTFHGHECYICFKLFKTKTELKHHCTEHFDICNDKMLKKCPFCGFVTSNNIKGHVEQVHKIRINYDYGHIMEKENRNGSKYVIDIGNKGELEVIPSISNLNKIACMKNDEKNRKNKNMFLGKTKLVKKGEGWVVEKESISINNEYVLPTFTKDDYNKLKLKGDSYLDRIKKLSFLAKTRGAKMLYPCNGCDKICRTMAALKLHSRRHEANPKRFKPKVWVNRHIEYKTKNRKNKNKVYRRPAKTAKTPTDNRKNQPVVSMENRFASPQPVKNKHKCDKQLIDFYKTNIKGKDIEFWQFLKIFNKMGRENVNDFKDLEDRDDVHFGLHEKIPVITENEPVTAPNEPVITENESVITENEPQTGPVKMTRRKKFTRAIMISKKEYMRRNEIKNEMRKRLAERTA